MHLITEKGVYEVSCQEIPAEGSLGNKFLVTLQEKGKGTIRKVDVKIGIFAQGEIRLEPDTLVFAAKAACKHVRSKEKGNEVNIHFGNVDLFRSKSATEKEIDDTLIVLIYRFFKEYSGPTIKRLSPNDLFISTDFNYQNIVDSLGYFVKRDVIKYSSLSGDEYELEKGGFEMIEKLQQSSKVSPLPENRYFQLVELSNKVQEPFVFVLMPFKGEEIEQKVYFEIIKPTVEKELDISCIRSDEVTDPGVINNQIFTLIRKAKLIIAETTSQNPNVFYEVGMAHTFNKDVFIFNNSSKKKLPFDISTIRAVFYDDHEDLKKKIIENLKDHVS